MNESSSKYSFIYRVKYHFIYYPVTETIYAAHLKLNCGSLVLQKMREQMADVDEPSEEAIGGLVYLSV